MKCTQCGNTVTAKGSKLCDKCLKKQDDKQRAQKIASELQKSKTETYRHIGKKEKEPKNKKLFLIILFTGFCCPLIWIIAGIVYLLRKHPWVLEILQGLGFLPTINTNTDRTSASADPYTSTAGSNENVDPENRNKSFTFVGADGNTYESGGMFCDWKGNYVEWGDPFYDAKGNLVEWGDPFYDSRGNYITWGAPFYDAGGNYINPK